MCGEIQTFTSPPTGPSSRYKLGTVCIQTRSAVLRHLRYDTSARPLWANIYPEQPYTSTGLNLAFCSLAGSSQENRMKYVTLAFTFWEIRVEVVVGGGL